MNILLFMMGGSGTRFGKNIPKQYVLIDSVPVFTYIIRKYNDMPEIDKIVIVSHKDWIEYVEKWIETIGTVKTQAIVAGGDTRSESVLNGLNAISKFASDDDVVLIHDATHPYVDEVGILNIIKNIDKYGGATLGAKQYDTVYKIDSENIVSEVIPRDLVISAASPEAFKFGTIYNIYTNSTIAELQTMSSAGAMALAHGINMIVIPASQINLKITYPNDMILFEKLVHTYFFPPTE